MRAKIRDTELFFDVEGAGLVMENQHLREKPVAFLIHGGPGVDHTSYKPSFSPLSEFLQLIYFDHRGQGRSARGPKETYTLENNVEDLEALRQYLGLEKVVIIGTSYGGMVALRYAIKYPENVSHLIVIATAASYRFMARAKEILAERGNEIQKKCCQRLWQGNFETETQLTEYFQILGPLYALKYDPALLNSEAILSVDAINVAFAGFLREFDLTPDLGEIIAPTLVLAGRHDWICPPEFSQEIAAKIPQAELKIFEESSHLIRVDQPDALIEAIIRFLSP